MKTFLKQLWQWILKYKKKLIYGALALFIGQICFFNIGWLGIPNQVYAQNQNTPSENWDFQKKATDRLQRFSFFNRWAYILLYPILILAWSLVDNSRVYAEIFSFDAVLWKLWNIVRNLANYALWFILIFKIFQFLTKWQKSSDMKQLLTSALIAWIWIQASWFLLAVLIDISNILTYSLWWLPIQILWNEASSGKEQIWNPYVFQTVVYFNFDDPDTLYKYLSSTWPWTGHFISECETFSFDRWGTSENLILAPKMLYYYDGGEYNLTESNACHVWDDVFYFNGDYVGDVKWEKCEAATCKDTQKAYKTSLEEAKSVLINMSTGDMEWLLRDGKIFQIKNGHLTWSDIRVSYWNEDFWLDVNNEKSWSERQMKRLHDILDGESGYVWVFSSLYSSLLNGWNGLADGAWIYASLLKGILSLAHTLAVWIPLIAMLVVFFMRIGVIWMAIVLSPAIILIKAFWWEEKVKKIDLLKYLTVSNLIGIIFSPAIICFAVSMSTVLVRVVATATADHIITEKTAILWWLIELNLAWFSVGIGKLICNVICVAISRFLVRSAVKASELWKSGIITDLEKLSRSAIWSAPIVPVLSLDWKWVEYFWIDKAFGLNDQKWNSVLSKTRANIMNKYNEADNEALNRLINGEDAAKEAASKQLSAYKTELTGSSIDDNWTSASIFIWENNNTPRTFADFHGADQESIIAEINKMGKDKLGNITKDHIVTLNSGVTYKFVRTRPTSWGWVEDVYKYEKQ